MEMLRPEDWNSIRARPLIVWRFFELFKFFWVVETFELFGDLNMVCPSDCSHFPHRFTNTSKVFDKYHGQKIVHKLKGFDNFLIHYEEFAYYQEDVTLPFTGIITFSNILC